MFKLMNAVKNIYRHKNKYIIFIFLYFILITSISICVNIFINMNDTTKNIMTEYAGIGKLELGMDMSDINNLPDRLTKKNYQEFQNMEHINAVKFLKYNFNTDFLKENASPIEINIYDDDIIANIKNLSFDNSIFISGYNLSLIHLVKNEFNIEFGRMFENDGECIITKNSKSKADESISWNKLEIGNKITIRNDDGINKTFTIVGIQHENPEDNENTNRKMIYTTLEGAEYFDKIALIKRAGIRGYDFNPITLSSIKEPDKINLINMGYEALVYLESPEAFLSLQSEMWKVEKYGFQFYIEPLFPNFRSLFNITRVMQNSAAGLMIIISLIIIFVTIITTIIMLNSRKYEIAVLRSVGMKKSSLILSYMIENLTFIWSISVVSLIIAQFVSPFFTAHVFEGIQSLVSIEVYEKLVGNSNTELLFKNIGLVFGGTTIIVVLSLIFECINIIRFEPLKIFNKQY